MPPLEPLLSPLRESEAATRGREAQFRRLAQSVPNQVWTATADGTIDGFVNGETATFGGNMNQAVRFLASNGVTRTYHAGHVSFANNDPQGGSLHTGGTVYVNGGGTLIQNATSHRSLWYYLFTLRAAHFLGNRVDMYGCGIGPVHGKWNIRLVKHVLNRSVDCITVRAPASMEELRSYQVDRPKILLSSDPALALKPASQEDTDLYLRRHGVDPEGSYLCLMLRTWYGFSDKAEQVAQAADYAYEKYGLKPIFLSLNVVHDSKAARQVTPTLKAPWVLIDDGAEPELLISTLSRMKVTLAMRLHGLILSAVSGVPLVGVSYDPKIGAFLDYLGTGSCFELNDVTAQGLKKAIDEAVQLIPHRAELTAKAESLRAVERINQQAFRELLP